MHMLMPDWLMWLKQFIPRKKVLFLCGYAQLLSPCIADMNVKNVRFYLPAFHGTRRLWLTSEELCIHADTVCEVKYAIHVEGCIITWKATCSKALLLYDIVLMRFAPGGRTNNYFRFKIPWVYTLKRSAEINWSDEDTALRLKSLQG